METEQLSCQPKEPKYQHYLLLELSSFMRKKLTDKYKEIIIYFEMT